MDLQKQLEGYANSDMQMARREGEIIMARTKKGNVNLSYADRTYKLVQDGTGEVLYEGKAKGCREVIVNLYDVVTS